MQPSQIVNQRYRIARVIAQGGFGVIYRAWDINLQRTCALKENLDLAPESQDQFAREAMILSNLVHPNLARVTDYFSIPGQGQYLVMDFVEGQDLQEMVDQAGGPLPVERVMDWIGQILDGLSYLHSQTPPVIHRDIKPANIKVSPQGRAVLVDFGIAKVFKPSVQTTQGAKAVTPGYSPPEQYGRGTTDPRTDIYALGATLYTLVTGQAPEESILRAIHDTQQQPGATNPAVSPALQAVIDKAMSLQPDQRFLDARAMQAAFRAAADPPANPPAQTAPAIPPAPSPAPPPPPSPIAAPAARPAKKNRSTALLLAAAAGLCLCAVLGVMALRSGGNPFSLPVLIGVRSRTSAIDGMVSMQVGAGRFPMGAAPADPPAGDNEKPQHELQLDDFWIDRTEVTNAMFAQFVVKKNYITEAEKNGWGYVIDAATQQLKENAGANWNTPHGPGAGVSSQPGYPVVQVSWRDAQAYCQWAGGRLPTEAQWEKAASWDGVHKHLYPWGDQPPDGKQANFADRQLPVPWANPAVDDGYAYLAPVGTYPLGASPYGALDMAGNVAEWVSDWYDPGYYSVSPAVNPGGPVSGQYRVVRGGSWNDNEPRLRTTYRSLRTPNFSYETVGFRCVR